jgi:hypothetical protein
VQVKNLCETFGGCDLQTKAISFAEKDPMFRALNLTESRETSHQDSKNSKLPSRSSFNQQRNTNLVWTSYLGDRQIPRETGEPPADGCDELNQRPSGFLDSVYLVLTRKVT